MPEPIEEAVDITDMARLLHCSTATVYRRVRSGEIPGFKLGTRWRFYPSEVKAQLSKPRDPWARSPQSRAARRRAA